MSITVIKPGIMDTLQDQGRNGYSHWGINPGGAMDPYAARVANMLVGNNSPEAVLEMHFPAPQLLFEQNALIALTGADFSATLNDELLPLWHPIIVRKNTILHFPKWQQGARCYLAVHGGFSVSRWLDSYSTNLKAGAGGFRGRKLEKNDELQFKDSAMYVAGLLPEGKDYRFLKWRAGTGHTYLHPNEIHFTKGHEWELLTTAAQKDLQQNNFIIHPSSDRMGYHLRSTALQLSQPREMVSSGVGFGTVQLLPNGQLIVLMADHQTTGGYPRIGHIINAHLPKLAQLRAGDTFQFVLTDQETAEEWWLAQQQELNILQEACFDHLNQLV
ncbi:MAG: biotin-dependent carboxyltransferase family protein [Chitinophagaceae bacterium]